MKRVVILLSLLFGIISCNLSDKDGDEDSTEMPKAYADYFYPTDSLIPFIYVFKNRDEPLDEKVHRIYRSESASDTTLIVEYYNSDLKITEGYTHSIKDDFKVEDHMIVDGDGKKRQAKISANTFFPMEKDEKTKFISDFPSHLDSITMIYQSKRRVLEEDTVLNVLGENVPAIVLEDSVKVLFANPFTQKSSAQNVVINRVFAKGFGMVRWSANNDEIVYELAAIYTNKWWDEYGQTPQVKQ